MKRIKILQISILIILSAYGCSGGAPTRPVISTPNPLPPYFEQGIRIAPLPGIPEGMFIRTEIIPCGTITFYNVRDLYGYIVEVKSETDINEDCLDYVINKTKDWQPDWSPKDPVFTIDLGKNVLNPLEHENLPPGGYLLISP